MRLVVVTPHFLGALISGEPYSHGSRSDLISRIAAVNAMIVELHAREGAMRRHIWEAPI
ncbi:MAG TPA: hypothetical protein VN821_05985 [Candidatus Udaeobacter sp.]|nr:hypothetical protein [Candidatus Udaeobacter sp.]